MRKPLKKLRIHGTTKWWETSVLIVIILLFLGALSIIATVHNVMQSFYDGQSWTLIFWRNAIASRAFLPSVIYSTNIVLISTTISIVLGILIARSIGAKKNTRVERWLLQLSFFIPHFIAGYLMYVLFSGNGIVTRFFQLVSIPFPELINDPYGAGIILSYVFKEVPFVVLYLLPVYSKIEKEERETIAMMGANTWQAFWNSEWPRLAPSLVEIFLILVSFLYGAYELPNLLGVTFPKFLSILFYDAYFEGTTGSRQEAFVIMTILTIFMFLLAIVLFRATKRYRMYRVKGGGTK